MRGHHHGAAALRDPLEEPHDPFGRYGVEVARRLVGQQQLGIVQQRTCDHQTLLFAAREFERHLVALVLQLDHPQHFVDAAADFALVFPPRRLHHVVEVHEDVAVGEELIVLKDDPELAPQIGDVLPAEAAQVESGHFAFARNEPVLGVERLEQRAFAAADAADQIDEFASGHFEVYVCEDHLAAFGEFAGRTGAERVVGVVDGGVAQPDDDLLLHLRLHQN